MGNRKRSKRSGVYRIRNRINGRSYVGSSTNIDRRFRTHELALIKGCHHSIKLQRAWNKNGKENFVFEIIEEVLPELLLTKENEILQNERPIYNVSLDAVAPMQGRTHSLESRKKMAKWKRAKGKDHHAFGKKRSPEHIRAAAYSRIGMKHSPSAIVKMRETAIRLNAISRIDRDTTRERVYDSLGNKFNSMIAASKFWNISVQTVCDILKGRHYRTRAKISFNYLHDEDIY